MYQGRFKSFPIQTDGHLLTVIRYVERNPVRATRSAVPRSAVPSTELIGCDVLANRDDIVICEVWVEAILCWQLTEITDQRKLTTSIDFTSRVNFTYDALARVVTTTDWLQPQTKSAAFE